MSAKAVLILCAQALFFQSALSQCTSAAAVDASGFGTPYGFGGLGFAPGFAAAPAFANAAWGAPAFAAPGLAYDGLAYPGAGCAGLGLGYDGLYAPAMDIAATSGGGFVVTSSSAIPPTGISIVSDNAYEGVLAVAGEVPFVGTTGMEGVVPTAGTAAVNHACGNGLTVMSSDASIAIAPATIAPSIAIAPAIAPVAAIAPAFTPAVAYGGCGSPFMY